MTREILHIYPKHQSFRKSVEIIHCSRYNIDEELIKMERYDEGYLHNTEEKADRIREKALQLVRVIHPEIECVIDRRAFDDYCEKIWDYPG